jgi:hypothetical protein
LWRINLCDRTQGAALLHDDTVRTLHRLYEEDGIEGLASFGYEGGALGPTRGRRCFLQGPGVYQQLVAGF